MHEMKNNAKFQQIHTQKERKILQQGYDGNAIVEIKHMQHALFTTELVWH